MLEISIIVPCRNEARALNGFLDSLAQQDFTGYDWEVVIADGMSDDGSRDLLYEFATRDQRIRVIDNPWKITSTGLNAAIQAAKGEIILRMDVHTEYAANYVRACVETLLSKRADNVGGPARTRAEGLLPRAVAAAYHSPFACGGAKFHDESHEGPVDTVPYGCWRKCTLEQLGLFDTELVRNQDDELNLRIVHRGGTIWQSPSIRSWYSPRSSLSSLFKQYYQYGFWKVPVILKYRIPASWRHLAPSAFVLTHFLLLVVAATASILGKTSISQAALLLLAFIVCLYSLCTIAFSVLTARRSGWSLLLWLPLTFLTYHLSYALGFLTAIGYSVMRKFIDVRPGNAVTQITR
jgi:glycosyltransferase involved in cell wall biosynthesis